MLVETILSSPNKSAGLLPFTNNSVLSLTIFALFGETPSLSGQYTDQHNPNLKFFTAVSMKNSLPHQNKRKPLKTVKFFSNPQCSLAFRKTFTRAGDYSARRKFSKYSKRRKLSKYSKRRKNSIAAIIFRLLFEEVSIFFVWLGRFARFAK